MLLKFNLLLSVIIAAVLIRTSHCRSTKTYSVNTPSNFEEFYFDQIVDHYNFKSYGSQTYKQRYLVNDKMWDKSSGPVFFYTGNEGDIYGFQEASGFLSDLAAEMNALVVFAEHRYYGVSLPFGNNSFTPQNIGLLTIEQALADYAYLIQNLLESYKTPNAPVITFGGSYGGMLSAYMRIKYPNLVTGALSASAPFYWISNEGDRQGFWKSVTDIFHRHSDACVKRVKLGFAEMAELAAAKQYKAISAAFKTCEQVSSDNLNHLYGWVRNSFTDLAMMNYPYPTDLLAPLPGYPVNLACDMILKGKTAMEGLAAGAGLFYNGTSSSSNSVKCFNTKDEYIECADPTGCGLGNDAIAWDYQACTEINLPGGSTNKTDMFPYLPFTEQMRADYCQKTYAVAPRTDWLTINFWTDSMQLSSNIIFSNGDIDPWKNGGVLSDLGATLPALIVQGGAHHFDLRGSNPKDPQSVKEIRYNESAIIKGWVVEHWKQFYSNW